MAKNSWKAFKKWGNNLVIYFIPNCFLAEFLVVSRNTHLPIKFFPIKSKAVRRELVKENYCPECGGELDTGWECNNCGYDANRERARERS